MKYPAVDKEIKMGDGHEYHDCQLKRVEADGVVISHRLGVAKLMFYEMPDEFKKCYGYNREAAKAANSAQEQRNADSDAFVAREAAREQARQNAEKSKATLMSDQPPASSCKQPGISPEMRERLEAQIKSLQEDIDFMERDQNKLDSAHRTVLSDNNKVNLGGYQDRIAMERKEITELQQQLR